MSFLTQAGTAGNMQTYQTQLQQQQLANNLANALNALKLREAQTAEAGSGIAGNALLDAFTQGQDTSGAPPAPATPPVMPPPVQSAPLSNPMSGTPALQGLPQGGPMPAIPPVAARSLQPPSPQMGNTPPITSAAPPVPAQAPGASAPANQGLTWKAIATAIKRQYPQAKGPEVMAAIDKLTPMMTAQNKAEWQQFKLQIENQQKEAQLQNQLTIANQRANTAERGQDIMAASREAALEQRAAAAEARSKELEDALAERTRHNQAQEDIQSDRNDIYKTKTVLDREEKAREADQRSKDVNASIAQRASAKSQSLKYQYEALTEKAREADQRSNNTQLSIQERKQAHDDSLQFSQQALQAKQQMFGAKLDEDQAKAALSDQTRRRGQDLSATSRAASLAERGREADQRNQTQLEAIKSRLNTTKKTNDPAYKALQDEYKTTAAAQRSMMINPGLYTDEQRQAMDAKVQALQDRVDLYAKSAPSGGAAPAAPLPTATPSSERVTVTKDGQDFTVPADQLAEAIKQGYKRK